MSGCVTTTRVGKPSTGWKEVISCYTHKPTQLKMKVHLRVRGQPLRRNHDRRLSGSPTVRARNARRLATPGLVSIGDRVYPVSGDTWEDYRCELMTRLSRDYVLDAARRVNPRVKLIIKYPQWYDQFHERGYEIVRETADFDRIWVGTETRDYTDKRWGGTVQYEAYFIMRWLGGLGR